jgi:hypothetical protein
MGEVSLDGREEEIVGAYTEQDTSPSSPQLVRQLMRPDWANAGRKRVVAMTATRSLNMIERA